MPWKPDVCVYHGGCDDGFGAALAVWKSWADAVQYVPAGYGTPLQLPNDGKDKHILFVDFLAKWVRPDKVDGKYLPGVAGNAKDAPEIWNWKPARGEADEG